MGSPRLREVLHQIRAARQRGDTPLVLFDLDGTLLRNGARHLAILRAFCALNAEKQGPVWRTLREQAESLSPDAFGYHVTGPLAPVTRPAHQKLLRFWSDRYFTNHACADDEPAPGAVDYVAAAHRAGAFVWYLTGRPEERMRRGTEDSLRQHGFPLDTERVALTLRGRDHARDADFKEVISDRRPHDGPVLAQFENEPGHANAFLRRFPDALHFLVGDVHSDDAPAPHPGLVLTDDFVLPEAE